MAIMNGADCMRCESAEARRDSHFCSVGCVNLFLASVDGPVRCYNCESEEETIAEAQAAGWVEIEDDEEGACWNYLGTCPECQGKEE